MHEHFSFPGFLQENTWVIYLIFTFYYFLWKVYRCHKPFLSCKKKNHTDSKHYLKIRCLNHQLILCKLALFVFVCVKKGVLKNISALLLLC